MTQQRIGDISKETPSQESAETIARLQGILGQLTTASLRAMEERLKWFSELDADNRSWLTVVARTSIDSFVTWIGGAEESFHPRNVFASAPRTLTHLVSLHQTVELMRVIIDVVEEQIDLLMSPEDVAFLQPAILHFSREIAFGAAEVYAQAAESRGAWDARLEALVVDAIVRAETDETVISRASALGWTSTGRMSVVVGHAQPEDSAMPPNEIRRRAEKLGIDTLSAYQGDRLVIGMGGGPLMDGASAKRLTEELSDTFSSGTIVIGPIVEGLTDAAQSARAALSGLRAASAWPEGPRILLADEILPERILYGDSQARRSVLAEVYEPLSDAGGDLLETCVAFLDNSGSVEATARSLYVHANTVRYRVKRIQDVTGYNATSARDAYVLRLAISLGRLETLR